MQRNKLKKSDTPIIMQCRKYLVINNTIILKNVIVIMSFQKTYPGLIQIRFTTSVSRKTSSSDENCTPPEAIPPKEAGVLTHSCFSARALPLSEARMGK